jgi:type IV pilus assembly protein PilY1
MNGCFRINTISLAVSLAFPVLALAAEPYPALPPTLSTAVTPNILLHVDNSGSMNNFVDGKRKIATARDVAKKLIDNNKTLRWGLFSFDPNSNAKAGILQAPVGSSQDTLNTAINGLGPDTWTPLGEALFEMTRYWAGEKSYYGKITGNYTSPIQYRCQKNFNIVITDGVSTKDNEIPGLPDKPSGVDYTTYTSEGVAQTKTFKACVNKNTVSSVTCPEKLEESLVNNAFVGTSDDASSYGRSMRDVAMFAYDKDMRVGGTDGDGKSFDDPKFQKQNVATYTVGFALKDSAGNDYDEPTLVATAKVGYGKYYRAGNEQALLDALTNAVNSIVASISNAGGVAAQSETTAVGNKVFQPVFNPNGWYGELRCYDLDANGNLITGGCTNPKAVIPAAASRNIYTSKVVLADSPPTSKFVFDDSTGFTAMTTNQKSLLGSTDLDRKKVINFIRGSDITGFRARPNGLLGDIIDGQPAVVSVPAGITTDAAYSAFISANSSRGIVLIGANDGMLHAFSIANMSELMAYIPSAVYPHLTALTATDYGQSTGTPHTFHVNGTLRQQDVKFGSGWKTIVASGLGQGGQGFLTVDATNESTMRSLSTVKWEWNDQNDSEMGNSFAAPLIYNVRTSASTVVPAVILANGYSNSYDDTGVGGKKTAADSSALYILNADTGALIKKISVTDGSGTNLGAGLSSPAGVDFGQDGILDYVYAGDMNGKVWRFDLTDSNPDNFKVYTTPIFDAGPTHPIVMRPAIKPVSKSDGTSLGNLVLFGTGKLLTDADRTDVTTQSFYAVLDDMSSTQGTVPRADLQQRTIDSETTLSSTDTTVRAGTYRKISTSPSLDLTSTAPGTKKGWYLDFPATTERLVTSPMLFDDKLLFGTGITQSSEKCLPGGKGWVMGLDPMTGSVTKSSRGKEFSFIDVKLDGKSTDADKVGFQTGAAFASGFSKDGIPTELTYVAASSKIVTTSSSGATMGDIGQVIALKEANMMGVYTGNAASGVSSGNSMGRPASTGAGKLYSGTIGDDKVEKETMLGTSFGVKVETSTWREIK